MKVSFEGLGAFDSLIDEQYGRNKIKISGDLIPILYVEDLIHNDLVNPDLKSRIFKVYKDVEEIGYAFIEKIKDDEYRVVFSRG